MAGHFRVCRKTRATCRISRPLEALCKVFCHPVGRHGAWAGRPAVLVVLTAVLVSPGCVRRRLTIRSNPPGALVYVDNYEIGTTPCSTDFTYYGTREIRLVKDGYETLTVRQPIPTPWYEIPGIDFFSENVAPGEIRDVRTISYELKPQVMVPAEQLLSRAEGVRQGAHAAGPIVPAPTQAPNVAAPLPAVPAPRGTAGQAEVVPSAPMPPATLPPPSQTGPVPQTLPPGGRPPIYAPPLP